MIRNGLALLIALGLSSAAGAGELDAERPGKPVGTAVAASGDALGATSGRELDRESPAQSCFSCWGCSSAFSSSGYFAPSWSSSSFYSSGFSPGWSSSYYSGFSPGWSSSYSPAWSNSYYSGYSPAWSSSYYGNFSPGWSSAYSPGWSNSYYSGYSPGWSRSYYSGW